MKSNSTKEKNMKGNIMRKKILTILIVVTVWGICGCGNEAKSEADTAQTTEGDSGTGTENLQDVEDAIVDDDSQNEDDLQTDGDNQEADDTQVVTGDTDTSSNDESEITETPFEETDVPVIEITSADLHDGVWDSVITNTKNGLNVSPQLSFEPVDGAESYMIYMVDNTATYWLHWISNNVTETDLEQGWAGQDEYVGPYPPDGTHEYEIYVIALKQPVSEVYGQFDKANIFFEDNKYNCNKTDDGQPGNILAIGRLVGTYTAGE